MASMSFSAPKAGPVFSTGVAAAGSASATALARAGAALAGAAGSFAVRGAHGGQARCASASAPDPTVRKSSDKAYRRPHRRQCRTWAAWPGVAAPTVQSASRAAAGRVPQAGSRARTPSASCPAWLPEVLGDGHRSSANVRSGSSGGLDGVHVPFKVCSWSVELGSSTLGGAVAGELSVCS